MIKRLFCLLIIISLLTISMIFGLSNPNEFIRERYREHLNTISDTSDSIYQSISWSILTRMNDGFGIICPNIIPNRDIKEDVVERINNTIKTTLLSYMESFVFGTKFPLACQINLFDSALLSIKYEGEVWTPAKAIKQVFALNFDVRNGTLLDIDDIFILDSVLNSLSNGSFTPIKTSGQYYSAEVLKKRYLNNSVISIDNANQHNFYISDNKLYLIIDLITESGFSIYYTDIIK